MSKELKVTLCPKDLKGDIPQYSFKKKKDALKFIDDWVFEKNYCKSVLVCFQNYRKTEIHDFRNEQTSILISHNWDDVVNFVDRTVNGLKKQYVDFAIFEFEDYQDALSYCKDLKECY